MPDVRAYATIPRAERPAVMAHVDAIFGVFGVEMSDAVGSGADAKSAVELSQSAEVSFSGIATAAYEAQQFLALVARSGKKKAMLDWAERASDQDLLEAFGWYMEVHYMGGS